MSNPLFSTYRGGENRVTSSTMAVFERIDLSLVTELLEGATGAGELDAVTFDNQVTTDASVPDARISGHFTWWFEPKPTAAATTPMDIVASNCERTRDVSRAISTHSSSSSRPTRLNPTGSGTPIVFTPHCTIAFCGYRSRDWQR